VCQNRPIPSEENMRMDRFVTSQSEDETSFGRSIASQATRIGPRYTIITECR
jgi:hypothetical protein